MRGCMVARLPPSMDLHHGGRAMLQMRKVISYLYDQQEQTLGMRASLLRTQDALQESRPASSTTEKPEQESQGPEYLSGVESRIEVAFIEKINDWSCVQCSAFHEASVQICDFCPDKPKMRHCGERQVSDNCARRVRSTLVVTYTSVLLYVLARYRSTTTYR